MRNKFAYIISWAFHPLLMPTYLFLFIILFASSLLQPIQKESLFQVLAIIFIVTFIIPAISIGTLRISNFISDLNLADKKQRITPFLFVTCFYAVTAYMFYTKLKISNLIFLILTIVAVLIFLLTLITYFWKISIHGAGIGGILGFMLSLRIIFPIPHFDVALSAAIIICGLVAFSRLRLNAHTPIQVYAGIVSGFIFCFLSLYFFF